MNDKGHSSHGTYQPVLYTYLKTVLTQAAWPMLPVFYRLHNVLDTLPC